MKDWFSGGSGSNNKPFGLVSNLEDNQKNKGKYFFLSKVKVVKL